MLKISEVASGDRVVTLWLEGRVVGPWVAEVSRACERLLGEGRVVKLNLAEVSFVDRTGLALLLQLRSRGVALDGCSAFVTEELKAATNK